MYMKRNKSPRPHACRAVPLPKGQLRPTHARSNNPSPYTNRASDLRPGGVLRGTLFPYVCFFASFFEQAKKEVLGCRGRKAPLQNYPNS